MKGLHPSMITAGCEGKRRNGETSGLHLDAALEAVGKVVDELNHRLGRRLCICRGNGRGRDDGRMGGREGKGQGTDGERDGGEGEPQKRHMAPSFRPAPEPNPPCVPLQQNHNTANSPRVSKDCSSLVCCSRERTCFCSLVLRSGSVSRMWLVSCWFNARCRYGVPCC